MAKATIKRNSRTGSNKSKTSKLASSMLTATARPSKSVAASALTQRSASTTSKKILKDSAQRYSAALIRLADQ